MASPPLFPSDVALQPHQAFILRPSNNTVVNGHHQLDEGYSEETRSQPDSDMVYVDMDDAAAADMAGDELLQMALALPEDKRKRESALSSYTIDSPLFSAP